MTVRLRGTQASDSNHRTVDAIAAVSVASCDALQRGHM
jgi:hypothetical protein